jgi:hypothetical protein
VKVLADAMDDVDGTVAHFELCLGDKRTLVGSWVEAVAALEGLSGTLEYLDELVVDPFLDEDTRARCTDLTTVHATVPY